VPNNLLFKTTDGPIQVKSSRKYHRINVILVFKHLETMEQDSRQCFILKIHQNTANYSYVVSIIIVISFPPTVSDRDQNVNNVRIIGCVLMNFQYVTFTNQMNLFNDVWFTVWLIFACQRQ